MTLITKPDALAAVHDARYAVRSALKRERDPFKYAALLRDLNRLNREAARLIAGREGQDAP